MAQSWNWLHEQELMIGNDGENDGLRTASHELD